ncbi:UDP-galactopyranose mutase [Bryocella elongata]|uniref:UDP-galactopyranose mutase n=1 Tax=Bryocella elongata TaxID=863522 RepID=A0A1H5Y5L0_9BACT|nr:NAD(P)/FAD-dependent oxidoreductase [Bryocella elongata]SEG18826.1 UDP-galactopyranose mutase [Bryocella elongata]
MPGTAIIIGAGPAGLTAALELLRRTGIQPIILEASHEIGGISRTIRYNGNRMDIGGHRFFSKSDRVMQWWMELMPPEHTDSEQIAISYQGKQRVVPVPADVPNEPPLRGMGPLQPHAAEHLDDEVEPTGHIVPVVAPVDTAKPSDDLVMLVRPRKSRIYYLRRFFDYPIKLSKSTIENLGPARMTRIGISYISSRLFPIKNEKSLEDFLINRFGKELYLTFFKSYTEKVWGVPCDQISAEWGAQRIKGLSLTTALKHFVKKAFSSAPANSGDLSQKGTDTSLIERFLYPKFGPGQLWEHVADQIVAKGGEIHMGWTVDAIEVEGTHVVAVEALSDTGERRRFEGDYFFSTMPMRDLVRAMRSPVPDNVREVSEGLQYRDFITVGVLANKLDVEDPDASLGESRLIKDTWIYIQEPDVQIGRLQIFNNWSPYMVSDPSKVWIGLEYFCYESDPLWSMPDEDLKKFAAAELEKIGILRTSEVLDAHVVRVPKTYPAYFGTYERFDELRSFTDSFDNLFLVGRNGMHKYNNQDHSMLTAMAVVDGLAAGHVDKASLWSINTEQEYHEEKKS